MKTISYIILLFSIVTTGFTASLHELTFDILPEKKLSPTSTQVLCTSARNHLSAQAKIMLNVDTEQPFRCVLSELDGEQHLTIFVHTLR